MRRILILLSLLLPSICAAQNIEELANVLWNKTSYREITEERREAMLEMQKHADAFPHTRFNQYNASAEDSALEQEIESAGIMRFYALAIDKLLKEIPNTKVKRGDVVMWQLYNMGYVVKTH